MKANGTITNANGAMDIFTTATHAWNTNPNATKTPHPGHARHANTTTKIGILARQGFSFPREGRKTMQPNVRSGNPQAGLTPNNRQPRIEWTGTLEMAKQLANPVHWD